MPEETEPSQPILPEGVDAGDLLARGLQSAKMSGGGAHGWEPLTVGEVAGLFPNYEVLAMLGRGGMGAVFKARQLALDRFVAIKLLPLEISVDQAFVDRFRREARAMAKLNHPHIISVYEFGQTREGHLFFVMEFVEGANLHDVIHQGKRGEPSGLNPGQSLSIAAQICTALAYAHGKGVVHRDIKPANVMIDLDGQVKVADFGLARLTDPGVADLGHTGTGTVMGTPAYMAPEQTRGMNVDHRADIYSLGVMLYEMLCRETPQGAFDLPSQRTGCDPRLDAIVLKAMQQAPERRYQNTQEMKTDVETARTPLPAAPEPPVVIPSAARPAAAVPKRTRLPLVAGLAAAIIILAASAAYWAKSKRPPAEPRSSAFPNAAGNAVRPSGVAAFTTATGDAPFVNGLGMKFVPVPIIGGPTGGQRVLFSIWETRVQDYEVFVQETKREWPKPNFAQGPTHPVVNMTWDDAQDFCTWLTGRERSAGRLGANEQYRLPSDHEWSCAVGIGDREDPAQIPGDKSQKLPGVFPWGTAWPPPPGAGNYSGEEVSGYEVLTDKGQVMLAGYRDGFPETAPVGSFAADRSGLFDLGGNVWEWCEDLFQREQLLRVMRGGSFAHGDRGNCLSSVRAPTPPRGLSDRRGFRIVLADSSSAPPPAGIADLLASPDYEWSAPENLGPGVNTAKGEDFPTLSEDGLILVFRSDRSGKSDLYESRRQSVDEPFGEAKPIEEVNTPPGTVGSYLTGVGLSSDGLTLLYASNQGGQNRNAHDIFQTLRRDRNSPWEKPADLGQPVNTASGEIAPCLSPDGLTLLFASDRPGGQGGYDLWRSRRKSVDAPFETPENLGSKVNTTDEEHDPKWTADNRTFFFYRFAKGGRKLHFIAVRDANGSLTVRLFPLPAIADEDVQSPVLSPDGRTLLFAANNLAGGKGGSDLWQIHRTARAKGAVASVTPPPTTPAAATKNQPFVNGLGMKFVPVPVTGGPTGGQRVLFSVWETRVRDFRTFVRESGYDSIGDSARGTPAYTLERVKTTRGVETQGVAWMQAGGSWENPHFPVKESQTEDDPVCCISYLDAEAFCSWLTKRDRQEGKLPATWSYRLPEDGEWTSACGTAEFPWGDQWPPMREHGNFNGLESNIADSNNELVKYGFRDSAARTIRVGSFKPNAFGLYDMGGNVWEWISTWYQAGMNEQKVLDLVPAWQNDGGGERFRVLRGASWNAGGRLVMRSRFHYYSEPTIRRDDFGFRVVASENPDLDGTRAGEALKAAK